ncbi:MAG: hypothetical protein NTV54_04985 [Ignavibacteriales bacterium]|nr:hypothetical protein [Ignavibacteriales bacterium]
MAILAVGTMVHTALAAADLLAVDGIGVEVVNMRFAKPLDFQKIEDIARRFRRIVTVEESSIVGGFGSAVAAHIASLAGDSGSVHVHGIPDEFVEQGTPTELYAITKLDVKGIAEIVRGIAIDGR